MQSNPRQMFFLPFWSGSDLNIPQDRPMKIILMVMVVLKLCPLFRSVAQFGQSTGFGNQGSEVRIFLDRFRRFAFPGNKPLGGIWLFKPELIRNPENPVEQIDEQPVLQHIAMARKIFDDFFRIGRTFFENNFLLIDRIQKRFDNFRKQQQISGGLLVALVQYRIDIIEKIMDRVVLDVLIR